MANIGNTYLNHYYGLSLDGTTDSDTIYGYGGNDWIYGGGGVDALFGGTGNDHIYAGPQAFYNYNAYWGSDYVEGGGGDDVIDFSMNLSDGTLLYGDSYTAYTDDGVDLIYGGFGRDTIYGGGNTDTIYGGYGRDVIYGDYASDFTNDGRDYLFGGGDSDSIYGGGGDDFIVGGTGADWLTGGNGGNTFAYQGANESGLTWSTADTITDWYGAWDAIDMPTAGTYSNYSEHYYNTQNFSRSDSFDLMVNNARFDINYSNKQYVFETDGYNGVLVADVNGDHQADTAIELQGITSLAGFDYWDIV